MDIEHVWRKNTGCKYLETKFQERYVGPKCVKLRENQGYSVTRIIMIYSFMLNLRFLRVLVKSGNYNRLHYAAQMAT
jgi:hypothetical protein